MADRLDIETRGGDKLIIERVEATRTNGLPRDGGYCISIWAGHRGGPPTARRVSIPRFGRSGQPGADSLVEFIGYPQETGERAERAEEQLRIAAGEVDRLAADRDRLSDELESIRATVQVLLDDLTGAWWLRAAEAYGQLKRWVEHSGS